MDDAGIIYTVGDLKNALKNVPSTLRILLESDSDAIADEVVLDGAGRVQEFITDAYVPGTGYSRADYFSLRINKRA